MSDDFFAARDGAETQSSDTSSAAATKAKSKPTVQASPVSPLRSTDLVVVGLAPVPVPVPVAQSLPPYNVEAEASPTDDAEDAPKPKRKRGRPPADASLTTEERKLNRLKKNRIAAQRSYKKRVENTNKLEKENQTLHDHRIKVDAALLVAEEQWRKYAAFIARNGLQSAAERDEAGLLLPPPQNAPQNAEEDHDLPQAMSTVQVKGEVAHFGVLPLDDFPSLVLPGVQ